jgi:sulfonate transport system permease protein
VTTVDHLELAEPASAAPLADPPGQTAATADLVLLPNGAARSAGRRRWLPRGIERLLGVVLLFAIWELAARAGWISPQVLAGPSTILTAGWDLARDGTLASALGTSLRRVALGIGIGVPIGLCLALIAGLSRLGDDLVDANVQMLRFVPIIALQPLLILWLGIGETAKVSLIVLGVAFPIYVNTHSAIRSLDPKWFELAQVVDLGPAARIRRIVLPGALSGFLVGLRMATAVAWLLLVFAEAINASSGLGYLMIRAQTFFQSDVIVVCLVIYAVLGLLSDALVRALERRLLRWQPGR